MAPCSGQIPVTPPHGYEVIKASTALSPSGVPSEDISATRYADGSTWHCTSPSKSSSNNTPEKSVSASNNGSSLTVAEDRCQVSGLSSQPVGSTCTGTLVNPEADDMDIKPTDIELNMADTTIMSTEVGCGMEIRDTSLVSASVTELEHNHPSIKQCMSSKIAGKPKASVEDAENDVGEDAENDVRNLVVSIKTTSPPWNSGSCSLAQTTTVPATDMVENVKQSLYQTSVGSVDSPLSLSLNVVSSNEHIAEEKDGIETDQLLTEESGKPDGRIHSDNSKPTVKKLHHCTVCKYASNCKKNVDRHMRRHTGLIDMCHYCGFSTCDPSYLKKHIAQKHEKTNKFKCTECSFTCSVGEILNKHIKFKHQGYRRKITERKCPHCDYTTTATNHVFQTHIKRKHSKVRPYACPHCSHTTTDEDYLKSHIRSVHEKIRPFKCPHCSYSAALKQNLNVHIKNVHMSNKAPKKKSKTAL